MQTQREASVNVRRRADTEMAIQTQMCRVSQKPAVDVEGDSGQAQTQRVSATERHREASSSGQESGQTLMQKEQVVIDVSPLQPLRPLHGAGAGSECAPQQQEQRGREGHREKQKQEPHRVHGLRCRIESATSHGTRQSRKNTVTSSRRTSGRRNTRSGAAWLHDRLKQRA